MHAQYRKEKNGKVRNRKKERNADQNKHGIGYAEKDAFAAATKHSQAASLLTMHEPHQPPTFLLLPIFSSHTAILSRVIFLFNILVFFVSRMIIID